jgi:hypothetical protein
MKITRLKKANLFRGESRYAFLRDEREIGHLVDPGNDDVFQLEMGERPYRIERTRSGIATGFLSGIGNFFNPRFTGEFRLVDASDVSLATARQPRLGEFTIAAGAVALNVLPGRGQSLAKFRVTNASGDVVGEISRGPWKITGRTDWLSSLPEKTDPLLEAFLLWLYVMTENRVEKSTD